MYWTELSNLEGSYIELTHCGFGNIFTALLVTTARMDIVNPLCANRLPSDHGVIT
jgi:hypothetical protein